ncbi:unnamed protein product [Gadus morhua 'NCC']
MPIRTTGAKTPLTLLRINNVLLLPTALMKSEVQWSRHGGGGGDGRRGFIRGPRWCTPPGTSRLDPPEYSVNTGVDSSRIKPCIDSPSLVNADSVAISFLSRITPEVSRGAFIRAIQQKSKHQAEGVDAVPRLRGSTRGLGCSFPPWSMAHWPGGEGHLREEEENASSSSPGHSLIVLWETKEGVLSTSLLPQHRQCELRDRPMFKVSVRTEISPPRRD